MENLVELHVKEKFALLASTLGLSTVIQISASVKESTLKYIHISFREREIGCLKLKRPA